MRVSWFVLILLAFLGTVHGDPVCRLNDTDSTVSGQRPRAVLSRQRRLVFPHGSAFVMTVSLLDSFVVTLPTNWFMDFEFDMIWPIPSAEDYKKKPLLRKSWKVKRRHRRELYANFEAALNSRNLPGPQCVLRIICEAKILLNPPGDSFVEDAIRIVLSNDEEVNEIDSYDIAYRTIEPCDAAYPCPFSFLQLLLYNLYSDAFS